MMILVENHGDVRRRYGAGHPAADLDPEACDTQAGEAPAKALRVGAGPDQGPKRHVAADS